MSLPFFLLLLLSLSQLPLLPAFPSPPNTTTSSSSLLRIAVMDWYSVDGTLNSANGMVSQTLAASFFVAAHLWNTMRADLFPFLEQQQQHCLVRKNISIVAYCDNAGNPRRAFEDALYVVNEIGVDAFAGFGGIDSSFAGALVANHFDVPVVDHWTSVARFSDKNTFPTYARTIPSDNVQADMIVSLIVQLQYKHVAVYHLNDGDDFAEYLAQSLTLQNVNPSVIQFKYGIMDNNIPETLAFVKDTGIHVIVCATLSDNLPQIADAAAALGLLDPSYLFIFTYLSRTPYTSEYQNSNVTQLLHGSLWVRTPASNIVAYATNPMGWTSFNDLVPSINRYLPPYGTGQSRTTCKNAAINAQLPSNFFTQATADTLNLITAFAHDAIWAFGLAACQDNMGDALYRDLMSVRFDGLSGVFGSIFLNATGDRSPGSAGFVLSNWNMDNLTNLGAWNPTQHEFDGLSDVTFRLGTGLDNKPIDIPVEATDFMYLPTWAVAVGCTEFILLSGACLLYGVWLTRNRKRADVISSQPVMLLLVDVGCFTSSFSIVTLFVDDNPTGLTANVDVNAACMASPVMFFIGMSLAVTALAVKSHRLWGVLHTQSISRPTTLNLWWVLSIVILSQLLLWIVLVAWIATAPLIWVRETITFDVTGNVLTSSGKCVAPSSTSLGFFIGVIVLFLLAMLAALVGSYMVRHAPSRFHESRYVFLALSSLAQACLIGIPTTVAVFDVPVGRFMVLSSVVFVSTMALSSFVFVPKINMLWVTMPNGTGDGNNAVGTSKDLGEDDGTRGGGKKRLNSKRTLRSNARSSRQAKKALIGHKNSTMEAIKRADATTTTTTTTGGGNAVTLEPIKNVPPPPNLIEPTNVESHQLPKTVETNEKDGGGGPQSGELGLI